MRPSAILVVLLILVASLVAATPAAARQPLALGVARQDSTSATAVDEHTGLIGQRPALWTLWSSWGDRGGKVRCRANHGSCAFPVATVRALRDRGITPVIWWQPTDPGDPNAGRFERYRNIIKGKHDKYIVAWAKAARKFGQPIIVRFAHEMNGTWFPWSISRFDNTPQRFTRAWRYIVRIFRRVGARNVRFLWSPFKQHCPGCPRLKYAAFYPGDAYVDYVGTSILNWGNQWMPMTRLLRSQMADLRRVTRKPVILPEVASNWLGGDKARWIRRGYKQAYQKWPNIRAIVYFDYDTSFAGQPDWRLVQPPDGSALETYRMIAGRRRFGAAAP